MRRMFVRCSATMLIVALAACSNGRGTLTEAPPPTSPGQTEPPPQTPPTPEPTPPPAPTPTPTPTPEPPPPTPPPTPPPPAPAAASAGYWFGTIEDESGRDYGARAMITGSGDMHFIVSSAASLTSTPEFLVYGNVCCESRVDAELKTKEYLSARERGARFRSRIEGNQLRGDVRIRGEDYEFSLDRSPRYEETLTLQDLAGTYSYTRIALLGSSTYTITIDPSGQLQGSHSNGCVYNGTVTIADAPRNLARLDVQLSNCPTSITGSGSSDGHYTGLGFLARDTPSAGSSTFLHSLIGHTWLGHQPTAR